MTHTSILYVSQIHSLQKKTRASATKGKKNKIDLFSCIDLTGPKSIARTALAGLSDAHKLEVDLEINNTLKKKINQEVKDTILDIAHRELLASDKTLNDECGTGFRNGALPEAHNAGINGDD
jgi:hypothetical protein